MKSKWKQTASIAVIVSLFWFYFPWQLKADTPVQIPTLEMLTETKEYNRSVGGQSLVVLHKGNIILEDYWNAGSKIRPLMLMSGTKSFVGIVALAAIEDGIITLDEKVCDILTEWKVDPLKSKITYRQLLTLTSGLKPDSQGTLVTWKEVINYPMTGKPGEQFHYGSNHLLAFGEALQRYFQIFYGETFETYLNRRILDPIGVKVIWKFRCKDGYPMLAGGAYMKATDWAMFGEMVRNKGTVNGKILIDPTYFDFLTMGTSTNPCYGLTWWLKEPITEAQISKIPMMKGGIQDLVNSSWVPEDMYFAAGSGAQRLYIFPSLDMVVVRQAPLGNEKYFNDLEFLSRLIKSKANIPFKSITAISNRTSFSVPMRDGEKLAGDLYSLNPAVPMPVVLIQTPYDKSKYWTQFELRIPFSLENYNVFITDWRGRFASSSAKKTKSNNATDGYDVVEWIAKQKWSNGKIGTYGGSALGDVQFKTASQKPPHLACAIPMVKDYRVDYNTYYFGGEFRKEQIQSLEKLQFVQIDSILSQPVLNQYWKTVEKLTDLSKTFAVPMLLITGWFDHYPDKVIRAFSDIQEKSDRTVRGKHKLIVGPWGHGNLGEIEQGDLLYPGAENFDSQEAIRFMDYYLRGIKNNWEQTPVIQYYQMGEEKWLNVNTWNEIKREEQSFYLQPKHQLGASPITCSGAGDYYLYDPANPTPSVGGKRFDPYNPKLVTGPVDQREKVENRADVLLYTSEPLTSNLPINGLIRAEIYFSSNQLDTDISVRFCDIYPDGKSILMAEGIQRTRFRNSLEKEELLIPEQIYKIKIDLQNIALTVLKGHQIRVIVSSASYPIFERNPNNGGKLYEDKRMMIALNSIYHDTSFPSKIIVPIRK